MNIAKVGFDCIRQKCNFCLTIAEVSSKIALKGYAMVVIFLKTKRVEILIFCNIKNNRLKRFELSLSIASQALCPLSHCRAAHCLDVVLNTYVVMILDSDLLHHYNFNRTSKTINLFL